jgi:uncharacterized membrane protein YgaE (UPF0421/DUF939 family)
MTRRAGTSKSNKVTLKQLKDDGLPFLQNLLSRPEATFNEAAITACIEHLNQLHPDRRCLPDQIRILHDPSQSTKKLELMKNQILEIHTAIAEQLESTSSEKLSTKTLNDLVKQFQAKYNNRRITDTILLQIYAHPPEKVLTIEQQLQRQVYEAL